MEFSLSGYLQWFYRLTNLPKAQPSVKTLWYKIECFIHVTALFLWDNSAIFLYNKQNNTRVLGNMKFISRVEQDISLVRFAHLWDILHGQHLEVNFIFPHIHVLFCLLYKKVVLWSDKNRAVTSVLHDDNRHMWDYHGWSHMWDYRYNDDDDNDDNNINNNNFTPSLLPLNVAMVSNFCVCNISIAE